MRDKTGVEWTDRGKTEGGREDGERMERGTEGGGEDGLRMDEGGKEDGGRTEGSLIEGR